MGWHGKLLRVNLTAGTCTPEDLNMEWAQAYLGQRGLVLSRVPIRAVSSVASSRWPAGIC